MWLLSRDQTKLDLMEEMLLRRIVYSFCSWKTKTGKILYLGLLINCRHCAFVFTQWRPVWQMFIFLKFNCTWLTLACVTFWAILQISIAKWMVIVVTIMLTSKLKWWTWAKTLNPFKISVNLFERLNHNIKIFQTISKKSILFWRGILTLSLKATTTVEIYYMS